MENGGRDAAAANADDGFVIRSGVRIGLKRELAFALKSQAALQAPLGRTRSGRASPSLAASTLPPRGKRPRKSDLGGGACAAAVDAPCAPGVPDPSPPPVVFAIESQAPLGRTRSGRASPSPSASMPPRGKRAKKSDPGGGGAGAAVDGPCAAEVPDAAPLVDDLLPEAMDTGSSGQAEPSKSDALSEVASTVVEGEEGCATSDAPMTSVDCDGPEEAQTVSGGEGSEVTEAVPPVLIGRRPPQNSSVDGDEDGINNVSADMSLSDGVGFLGTDESADVAKGVVSAPLSVAAKQNMELKMSKKIALRKLPANPRELLLSGLLDGVAVKYPTNGKQDPLRGTLLNGGILCFCETCQGFNIISAYQFEIHAGSLKKYPWDYIILENGLSLRKLFEASAATSLDLLERTIQDLILPATRKKLERPMQNPVIPVTQRKISACLECKEPIVNSLEGELICDLCADRKQLQTVTSPPRGTDNNARSAGSVFTPEHLNNVKMPKKTLSHKKSISGKITKKSAGSIFTPGQLDNVNMLKNTPSHKKSTSGKITKKDVGLHKLVFATDTLPEGTEVGYYIRGQKLLGGLIKESGILCNCCSNVVTPSQFETHAGQAKRRKPYNHIYTSNGVSLHELSVSLSKGRKSSSSENDDLCSICIDGGDLICCDLCPRAFHKECLGFANIPEGDWFCNFCKNMLQREKCLEYNKNAYAAGRVPGVDPIEQIYKRCIRIVNISEKDDAGGCVFCRHHDFSKSEFSSRTVLLCDQCEREFHVGCLKENNMEDLKELPEGEWFCSNHCRSIHAVLQDLLLRGPEPVPDADADIIRRKHVEKGLNISANLDISWRILSGKSSAVDCKLLLSKALSILQDSFDPIVDVVSNRDLIPYMLYGMNTRDQDFGGMYCAVLSVGSSVVSVGILRILGCDVAELPLVATNIESQGLGYFQLLFSCIERLLASLNVKHFVLPAAEEAEAIWTQKFGFARITAGQLGEYAKAARTMIFQGTSMLHKHVPPAATSSLGGSAG